MGLPKFIEPMLAQLGEPFDAEGYLFEIKWDGFRALAFRDEDRFRLRSRRDISLAPRYPELEVLSRLAPGTVLDGELVLLRDGMPDFEGLLSREQVKDAQRAAKLASTAPVALVAFDLLYEDYKPVMKRPLRERRERMVGHVEAIGSGLVVASEGIEEHGVALFEQAAERGLEGVVGKSLDSIYQPGRRSDHWVKVKRTETILCVIIGYLRDSEGGVKSLLVAADRSGTLTFVGRVGSGLGDDLRAELASRLEKIATDQPVVACDEKRAHWVEPQVFCQVKYNDWTRSERLRAPVFVGLVEG